jgi:hypothetical protein
MGVRARVRAGVRVFCVAMHGCEDSWVAFLVTMHGCEGRRVQAIHGCAGLCAGVFASVTWDSTWA